MNESGSIFSRDDIEANELNIWPLLHKQPYRNKIR